MRLTNLSRGLPGCEGEAEEGCVKVRARRRRLTRGVVICIVQGEKSKCVGRYGWSDVDSLRGESAREIAAGSQRGAARGGLAFIEPLEAVKVSDLDQSCDSVASRAVIERALHLSHDRANEGRLQRHPPPTQSAFFPRNTRPT